MYCNFYIRFMAARNLVNANHLIDDRRRKSERRAGGTPTQFPIITTLGVCIRRDRRYTPERRISSIVVREWEIKNSIFELIFKDKGKRERK